MSTCKSSMTMGALAKKTVDWMEVPDKELATDLDDTDLVGDAKAQEKQEQEWKHQVEEVEKCQKEEEERRQKEAEAEQKQKDEERKQAAAVEAQKWQQVDSEAQASGSWTNASVYIRCARLKLTCIIPAGVKKRLACGLCAKAKEQCEWPKVEMTASRAGMSPRGGEHKKWAKKAANNDDNEIVVLSSQKTKRQGGGKMLEEISDRRWGELIQAVSSHMDIANGHLEKIVSMAQSNRQKMQHHYMLMEGLVGQQQVLLSKLVKITSNAGSGRAKEVIEGQEELQELQGEGLGGQEEEMQGVPGDAPGNELENAPGNELGNGMGAEDGTGGNGPESKAKDKGKQKAL
ncbi:hypothetical protein ID866_11265 [Astraeus odoratus]|nr:hypothetical protein ID866_11265 [Astraeus odoratus]